MVGVGCGARQWIDGNGMSSETAAGSGGSRCGSRAGARRKQLRQQQQAAEEDGAESFHSDESWTVSTGFVFKHQPESVAWGLLDLGHELLGFLLEVRNAALAAKLNLLAVVHVDDGVAHAAELLVAHNARVERVRLGIAGGRCVFVGLAAREEGGEGSEYNRELEKFHDGEMVGKCREMRGKLAELFLGGGSSRDLGNELGLVLLEILYARIAAELYLLAVIHLDHGLTHGAEFFIGDDTGVEGVGLRLAGTPCT